MSEFLLPLHLLTLTFVIWNVFHADHLGFAWVRGKVATLNGAEVRKYHIRVWIGLIGMIITGFLMFLPMREYLLTRPQFYTKMAFVLMLLMNGFVIGKFQTIATSKPYSELTDKEKLPLFISGAVSTLGWLGAATTAFFLVEEF